MRKGVLLVTPLGVVLCNRRTQYNSSAQWSFLRPSHFFDSIDDDLVHRLGLFLSLRTPRRGSVEANSRRILLNCLMWTASHCGEPCRHMIYFLTKIYISLSANWTKALPPPILWNNQSLWAGSIVVSNLGIDQLCEGYGDVVVVRSNSGYAEGESFLLDKLCLDWWN